MPEQQTRIQRVKTLEMKFMPDDERQSRREIASAILLLFARGESRMIIFDTAEFWLRFKLTC